MSRFEFKLPDIGEGVAEGEIVKWLVAPGETIAEDQPMVEVMTDKATVPITSPKSGRVLELCGKVGDIVAVHAVLVVLELANGGASASVSAASAHGSGGRTDGHAGKAGAPAESGPAATAVGDIREDLPGTSLMPQAERAAPAPSAAPVHAGGYFNDKPLATPATRKLARELGVDLRSVPPSGPSGRVVKDDVRALRAGAQRSSSAVAPARPVGLAAPSASGATIASPAAAAPPSAAPGARTVAPVTTPPRPAAPSAAEPTMLATAAGPERRVPLRGLRKRIFEQMAKSKHTAAHFTFVEECDVTALKACRDRFAPLAAASGVKLTYLPFIVKAAAAALKKHPALNAAFDERTQEVVERGYYHVGIASATEGGLMVPVVKHADQKSLLDVARDIARLSADTKAGTAKPDDLRGSTFTVTSLGALGGYFATPILNHPEVAILGVHRIKERPVVRDGAIVVGEVMLVSLSFDHRLIDGHMGAAFAYELIGYLENPDKLWLEGG